MPYLDKCSVQTDLLLNTLKPSRNLVVFIVSENCYVAHTLADLKTIMDSPKKHYIEDNDRLETFFYLPNGIRIDSSLSICFNYKVNTMKFVKSEHKFRLGLEANKRLYSYYSVEPALRLDIDSEEDSSFSDLLETEQSQESEVEIDAALLLKQREERKDRETLQIKRKLEEDKKSNITEIIDHGNGVKCVLKYKDGNKKLERWYLNDKLHREILPALIAYFENGEKKREEWFKNGRLYRANDLPNFIFYREGNNHRTEVWEVDGRYHRDNDLPAEIGYYSDGNKSFENWFNKGWIHRDNDKPAMIEYDENGCKKEETWHENNAVHRNDDKPARILYYENGNKQVEMWAINGDEHRDNDKPAWISYYENGNKKREEWKICGRFHRNDDKPFIVEYNEDGLIENEEW